MNKPDDIPQGVWDAAAKAHGYPTTYADQPTWVAKMLTITARAIMQAKRDAYEEAAKVLYDATDYMHEERDILLKEIAAKAIRKLGETS